jgi:hypothetical protein
MTWWLRPEIDRLRPERIISKKSKFETKYKQHIIIQLIKWIYRLLIKTQFRKLRM